MGTRNSKRPLTLEQHTSFDVLPTEYFQRRALQQQFQGYPQSAAAPLPVVGAAPQLQSPGFQFGQLPLQQQSVFPGAGLVNPGLQGGFGGFYQQPSVFGAASPFQTTGFQAQALSNPYTGTLALGASRQPYIQSEVFGPRPLGFMGQQSSSQSQQQQQQQQQQAQQIYGRQGNASSRRNYEEQTSGQQVQSVPKFNQAGPAAKF